MQVKVSDAVKNDPGMAREVTRGMDLLRPYLDCAPTTSADLALEWYTDSYPGAPLTLRLTTADPEVRVERRFPPEDLRDDFRYQSRLSRAWSELLGGRQDLIHARVLELLRRVEEEERAAAN